MKYTVHFELFGVKKKAKVEATSPEDAKYKVMGAIMKKIVWGEVETLENDPLEHLKNIFGL